MNNIENKTVKKQDKLFIERGIKCACGYFKFKTVKKGAVYVCRECNKIVEV